MTPYITSLASDVMKNNSFLHSNFGKGKIARLILPSSYQFAR